MKPFPSLMTRESSGEKLSTFTGHRDCVYTLEASAQADQFFSAAGDGMVVQWDLAQPDTGQLVAKVRIGVPALSSVEGQLWIRQNFEGLRTSLTWHPDGKLNLSR